MGWEVVDNKLWAQIKSGEYTGFSIGGSAVRTARGGDEAQDG